MKKLRTAEEAIKKIKTGDILLVGGFGLSGSPLTLIDALTEHDARELTVVSNNLGEEGRGLGRLLVSQQLKKAIGSYFTTNRDAVKAWAANDLEIELIPQGTLAESLRAGGAGIAAYFTRTGVGTELVEGKEMREFDGEPYVLEQAIKGEVSLVKALKADSLGNLYYHKTAMNFNPEVATAGDLVIAEVDEIVETGDIAPEDIGTPHIYVDYVVLNDRYIKEGGRYIEQNVGYR
ncbi:3-oxoacid CoA-transferase subunit A/3-oxoadipate CoA-transferase, alpha subunit [Thalassobacillus cyri]|uniref:3-oxoacid CoA-transferase subunit A/3-oxoadipate CoA-transferase, alpha subunit n=1 Tax=Thalassobacillus cyri TaxID=571932 RepID=A0A1H4E8D6_9BACI|nr:CoA transferase subunit A [Thalassobacillus cyri]SEA80602.1 3-oxoacid CoA-transferase subunit A/3-oxoadipate CoA-transferase, alpha subunit [Thalassobacillus cyri]